MAIELSLHQTITCGITLGYVMIIQGAMLWTGVMRGKTKVKVLIFKNNI